MSGDQVRRWEIWLYGLTAAFVGGGSSSVTGGLASMGIDPEHFNLQKGLGHTLELMGAVFVVNGLLSACLYLKQSPLPALGSGKGRPAGPALALSSRAEATQ